MLRQRITPDNVWKRIDVGLPDACWTWKGKIDRYGYGQFQIGKRHWKAHRFICAIMYGERDALWCALHSCDNRACCNPAHLRWGTRKENTTDMMIRGRHVRRGKLSLDDHVLIRLLCIRGCRAELIAEAVGISVKHAITLVNRSKLEISPSSPPAPPLAPP